MIAMIKILPVIAMIGLAGYGVHYFMVKQLNNQIIELENKVTHLVTENVALQSAAQINENTINRLEQNLNTQLREIGQMQVRINQVVKERDDYMSIFRRHDLTRLARARPGLIESRVNDGTTEVFRQIEEDTREVQNADRR